MTAPKKYIEPPKNKTEEIIAQFFKWLTVAVIVGIFAGIEYAFYLGIGNVGFFIPPAAIFFLTWARYGSNP